ncbi:hypothetical protein HRI_004171300 [Hibiscus trionum]|uniref:Inner centromere protein ARK-binding domain-containing protein n=1 Tax=Hibiscus trionum TaxID=183268 RepID=A0A9W7MPT5_HIBTR|nr:hypothetical protein HRI_004171300 [Hibiscus trionum]
MSTIEKALIQIFERKNRIIDNAKQQILLFDHQLASKCLIDGFAPPPWLLSSAPSQLNKEDLISGLLLPHQQSSFPYCSLYQHPVVTADNVLLPRILCSQVNVSNDGLDHCLSGQAGELDPSVTSPPQDCRDGMTSDMCPDLCSSLARIQRSKSRQRALEHRNSAKACKNNESCEKNGNSFNGQNKASKVASLQSDIVNKLELTRSGDTAATFELEKEEIGQCSSKGKIDNVYSGRVTRTRSSIHPSKSESVPLGTGNNSFVAKKNNVASYEVEKGKSVECRSKERNEKVCSGRVTRSRSSAQPSKSMSGLSGKGNTSSVAKQDSLVLTESIFKSRQQLSVHELLESEFVEPVHNTVSCDKKTEERGQCWSKARGEDVYSGRITRSRSSVQSPKYENSSTGAGKSFSVPKQDDIVLREFINKSGLEHDAAEERGQCRSKARGEDVYSGRITRSRSSVQPAKSENSPPVVGKSFTGAKQDGIVLSESIRKSGLEHAADVELLQFAKPVDDVVTCMVENEERGQFQSTERDESIHSGSVTRAGHSVEFPKSVSGISCAGKTSDVVKCYGNTSIEPICESKEQNNVVDELLELVKPPAMSAGSCVSKKAKDPESKEKENNACQGRLERSRSSSQQQNYENKHLKLDSCPERSTDDGICKSMQVACHARDLKELIKPCDITDESCGREARTSDNQRKLGTVVDQYTDDSTKSRANCGANMFKLVDSSNGLESEVKRPKSKDSNKPPYAKSPDRSKRNESKEVSGTEVNSLPCANDSALAGLNQCDAIVADTNANSDELVEAHLASSASNLDGAKNPLFAKSLNMYNRVDLEVVRTSQHSESAMTVLPKQLDFDDLGECTLNGTSSLILEHGKVSNSPLPCADKLDEATSVLYRKRERGSETDLNKVSGPGRTSNLNVVSSVKESSKTSTDAITSILPESNEISGQKTFMEDLSTTFKVSNENLLGNSPNDAAPSDLNADTEMDYLFKDYGKLEEVKSVMSAPKASNLNTDVCSCPSNLEDIDFTGVCNPALLMKADVTSSDASEHPCAAPFEETKGHPLKQNVEPSPSQNQDADSLGRYIADDIGSVLDHIHAKSSENKVMVQSIQPGRHSSTHVEGSWPHKRRKIEDQLSNPPSLSLSLKGEYIMLLNADKSLADGEDQNAGKCNWQEKVGNENTPSTFMHKRFGVVSISSLPQQTLENIEDHLVEGTREVYPSNIMFSGDGNIEHFTCDGRSKQERKSQLGEDGDFATSRINSPCQLRAGVLSADQSRPEVEGFIIPTDSEQVCTGGDGISFPNLDLPKTTIERAGLLEQLCKSACSHTPLSQFPTTYRLHRTTDLYQSVPNGLLECMDQRSTLPNNDVLRSQLKVSTSCFGDDTNNAFLGRSFSDCLPFSSSQVTGDGKKLYLSPIAKLWDKIASYSGSSEKRRTLNPDLPCINEENENTDEVVDRFQEDAAFEVVASSVKREPLADIKEYPNVAAVVSGAEQFTVRDSLDSVNTSYSFTGTENGIKPKVGKHNASKRRDTGKLKQNRNMLPGANDTKRASESLRNRSSKLQLSEKTSLRKGGPSFSQKEPKVNNIVSNITSFIPIVQQKQAASIITGKRDVKVKALEAAEAAKKLAEKKENDRKMKKEALKLERARLEQENLRQLELEKKKKEEERKKKEADMAAKKRLREEEEKLEKERKRKHMEEARKQQRALEEKVPSKKDENEKKSQALDERGQTMKVPIDEAAKHKKVQKEIAGGNGGKVSEMELRTAVASTSVKPCTAIEDNNAKVMSTMDGATGSDNPIADISREQSYDITPYKGSDDEDEDEDDEPNNKFIPSWASKKRVALVVASQQQLDPEVIFPPGSFCSISEVLLPRKLQQNRGS